MTAEHRSERRLVTCLFLDVVGSTDMTVSLGPERMKRAVEVRIGVETGEALIDLDAVDMRQQMAVGTVVNLAARLQSHADAGEIVVGPTCRGETADVAEYAHERSAELKGIGAVSIASLV